MYHENLRLLLICLAKCTGAPSSTSTFTNSIVCDPSSKQCMTQECVICRNKISTYELAICNAESNMAYFQWQKNDDSSKVGIKSTTKDAFVDLENKLKPFLFHVHVKRKQSAFTEKLLNNVNNISIVL